MKTRPRWWRCLIVVHAMFSIGVLLAACSQSNSSGARDASASMQPDGSFTGVFLCEAGAPPSGPPCTLGMTLQGGISETFQADSCGGDEHTSLQWGYSPVRGEVDQVTMVFAGGLPVDQLGTFALDHIEIERYFDDGGSAVSPLWRTPAGACSVTITGSVCVPYPPSYMRFLYGSGGCTQPAAPEPGNDAGPVTIGDFTFVGET